MKKQLKVLILSGLQASGKSTFAKDLIKKEKDWKRINKDLLREMFDDSVWSKKNEDFILRIRDELIVKSLQDGYNVVVDDTNLHKKHKKDIAHLVEIFNGGSLKYEATVEEKFFDISLNEAIKRDLTRSKPVGEKVIRDTYNRYLKPTYIKPTYIHSLPNAIICDIDGTLAHMVGRGAFEWNKVDTDIVDTIVKYIVKQQKDIGHEIILLSGRDSICRELTEKWLKDNDINYDLLLMRSASDNRKDSIIKEEIYKTHIKNKYNVLFVLDDRDQVVEMWRKLGLKCLQVAEGNF